MLIALTSCALLIFGFLGTLSREFIGREGLELDGVGATLRGSIDQCQR